MRRKLTPRDIDAAVRGGSVFACGGGGWADHGRMLGREALAAGSPDLVSIDEVPDDALIATAAAIGAPAGTTQWEMRGQDYVRAAAMLQTALGKPLAGFIVGQNGMSSTLNGWLPAAALGLDVIDAVGDVRAHPTGDMGSLGMASDPSTVIQTAAGGHRASHSYIELVVRGATACVSPVLRAAADCSGGFIASCRNALPAHYVKAHAALGGISLALSLGEAILSAEETGGDVAAAICDATGGTIIAAGRVARKRVIYTKAAFDIGTVAIDCGKARPVVLHVMNEFMAVDGPEGRIATYPDVITLLDSRGGPISVGMLREGDDVLVFHLPKQRIPLSSSVRDPSVYPVVEQALGIEIARHALGQPT